jgi:hypothetical protein
MRMLGKFGVAVALMACVALLPAKSEAATITAVGDSFSFSWSFDCGTAGTCTGSVDFVVTEFTDTSLGLMVTVNNTLDAPGELYLVGVGWDLDPTATSILDFTPGTYLDNARLNIVFPTAGGTLDVCTDTHGTGSCGSGGVPSAGIPSPGTDTFTIVLGGNFGSSVDLSRFFVKYAGDAGSFEGEGTNGNGGEDTQVPEPASLLLFGLGALAAGYRASRTFRV